MEARALRRRDSESSATSCADDAHSPTDTPLSHIHARCIPFATRVRFPDYYGPSSPFSDDDYDDEGDSDSDMAYSPFEHDRGRPLLSSSPPAVSVYQPQPHTLENGGLSEAAARPGSGARKSVNFAAGERPQVVFRYPSEDLVGAFLGEKAEEGVADDDEGGSGSGSGEEDDDDDDWWWHGWEEPRDDEFADAEGPDCAPATPGEGEGVKLGWIKFEGEGDEAFPFAFDEAQL